MVALWDAPFGSVAFAEGASAGRSWRHTRRRSGEGTSGRTSPSERSVLLPLRSVTGAMPVYFWKAAASTNRPRCPRRRRAGARRRHGRRRQISEEEVGHQCLSAGQTCIAVRSILFPRDRAHLAGRELRRFILQSRSRS